MLVSCYNQLNIFGERQAVQPGIKIHQDLYRIAKFFPLSTRWM